MKPSVKKASQNKIGATLDQDEFISSFPSEMPAYRRFINFECSAIFVPLNNFNISNTWLDALIEQPWTESDSDVLPPSATAATNAFSAPATHRALASKAGDHICKLVPCRPWRARASYGQESEDLVLVVQAALSDSGRTVLITLARTSFKFPWTIGPEGQKRAIVSLPSRGLSNLQV